MRDQCVYKTSFYVVQSAACYEFLFLRLTICLIGAQTYFSYLHCSRTRSPSKVIAFSGHKLMQR